MILNEIKFLLIFYILFVHQLCILLFINYVYLSFGKTISLSALPPKKPKCRLLLKMLQKQPAF